MKPNQPPLTSAALQSPMRKQPVWIYRPVQRPLSFSWLLPLLLFLALHGMVQAEFLYDTTNGTITITGYTGPGGAVTIPETINGLPVRRIGDYAFTFQSGLSSVTIPNTVTNIGVRAFADCSGLTDVFIGNGVLAIGTNAFGTCVNLKSITIPNSVINIGPLAFDQCFGLTEVIIGDSVVNIGSRSLRGLHQS